MKLELLGWNTFFANQAAAYLAKGYLAARVTAEHKHIYRVYAESGEFSARVSGRLRHRALGRQDFPAVGDWVAIDLTPGDSDATIHAVLPRRSKFSRKVAGAVTEEQIVAANVDTVFLVSAMDNDFNLRRIERYLTLAWESGANPVIVLNKSDLCGNISDRLAKVYSVAPGVPVHAISCVRSQGLDELASYLNPGYTVALLGSSGVGKSTLVNNLLGENALRVSEVRKGDGRGRHTTTHRELILLPRGGLIIDSPGMRELQLWEAEDGLTGAFDDIERLAGQCRFSNCGHHHEPGCAVIRAQEEGTLDPDRLENYKKLQKELAYLERREDPVLMRAEKEKWKKIHNTIKKIKKR